MPTLGKPLGGVNPYSELPRHRGAGISGGQLNALAGDRWRVGRGAIKVADGKEHGRLDKDGFLRLLMHQLSNQNPLKPMDQSKMAADLAQFSQLEQMANMNKNLERVLADDLVKKQFFAASLLGKKIMAAGNTLKHPGGKASVLVNFTLPVTAVRGMVTIYNLERQVVAQLDLGGKSLGNQRMVWDGLGLDGQSVPRGDYRFQVKAWDGQGLPISVATQIEGVVDGINYDSFGQLLVRVGEREIALNDIQGFRLADN